MGSRNYSMRMVEWQFLALVLNNLAHCFAYADLRRAYECQIMNAMSSIDVYRFNLYTSLLDTLS